MLRPSNKSAALFPAPLLPSQFFELGSLYVVPYGDYHFEGPSGERLAVDPALVRAPARTQTLERKCAWWRARPAVQIGRLHYSS